MGEEVALLARACRAIPEFGARPAEERVGRVLIEDDATAKPGGPRKNSSAGRVRTVLRLRPLAHRPTRRTPS
jgi:hypothetical protein